MWIFTVIYNIYIYIYRQLRAQGSPLARLFGIPLAPRRSIRRHCSEFTQLAQTSAEASLASKTQTTLGTGKGSPAAGVDKAHCITAGEAPYQTSVPRVDASTEVSMVEQLQWKLGRSRGKAERERQWQDHNGCRTCLSRVRRLSWLFIICYACYQGSETSTDPCNHATCSPRRRAPLPHQDLRPIARRRSLSTASSTTDYYHHWNAQVPHLRPRMRALQSMGRTLLQEPWKAECFSKITRWHPMWGLWA